MKIFLLQLLLILALMDCGGQKVNDDNPTNAKDGNHVLTKPIVPSTMGKEDYRQSRIAFYNVENLFDIKNEKNKDDDEFTPQGKMSWTEDKYKQKINHLAKVIDFLGEPDIMGLCEVENEAVLKDLINHNDIKEGAYEFVHRDSPDNRGIDVALLYDRRFYELVEKEFITINFPANIVQNYTTREIVYAHLKNKEGEHFHVLVNHWPSRRGGVEESQPKRLYVAEQARAKVDEIISKYDNHHIVLMGDFNDEPINKSISEVLGAQKPAKKVKSEELYNLLYEADQKGEGSHNYRGDWGMLDQIIVSGSLLDKKGFEAANAQVFNRKWMLFYHRDTEQYRPNRTYSGGKHYGGYSDHLPVMVEIKKAK